MMYDIKKIFTIGIYIIGGMLFACMLSYLILGYFVINIPGLFIGAMIGACCWMLEDMLTGYMI